MKSYRSLKFKLQIVQMVVLFTIYHLLFIICCYAQEKEPIDVRGDKVEYFVEEKKIEALGNVVVTYQNIRLSCNKITVFTDLKQAEAEGCVRIEEEKGVIEAEKVIYNFETKEGVLIEAKVQVPPFYGRSKEAEKISEKELEFKRGYITTCNLAQPHYRIESKRIWLYLDDKVVAKNTVFKVGKIPLMYLPTYIHPLSDKRPRVTVVPGYYKDWGLYLLTAWRYYFCEEVKGRIHLDWRKKKGFSEGLTYNYSMQNLGRGRIRLYHTQEKDRFLGQLRHRLKIDEYTDLILEYHKMKDKDFLKDYFFREYEKDFKPKTYLQITRILPNYTLSLLFQKRTNRFYDEIERLPELRLSINKQKIFESLLYFKNQSCLSNLTKKKASPSDVDDDVVRADTYNQISIPVKISFLEAEPYIGFRQTYFTKDIEGNQNKWRSIFYSGIGINTRFLRIYDFKTDFLGLEINKLQHVISPQVRYSYIHRPSISPSKLMQFDEIDSISKENRINLYLENKLQTKKEGRTFSLLRFICSTDYLLKSKKDSGFSDLKFDLELTPYKSLRFESDAVYDLRDKVFKTVNLDLSIFSKDRWDFGLGHRYQRSGESELTSEFSWRINPKWKVCVYERFQFDTSSLKEQQYSIYRDLHCWEMEISCNLRREYGESVWIIFRLKAFPEVGFEFNKHYHRPKDRK